MSDINHWYLEIVAGEGRCQGHLLFQRHLSRPVIWDSTPWVLPDVALTQRGMLQELVDLGLVFAERHA